MSCWCDGDDPGCSVCHPNMLPDARAAFRLRQGTATALLHAARSGSEDDLVTAAKAYRDAVEVAGQFDIFGQEVK